MSEEKGDDDDQRPEENGESTTNGADAPEAEENGSENGVAEAQVPEEELIPKEELVLEEGLVPEEDVRPEEDAAPKEELVFEDGLVPAVDGIPENGLVPEEDVIPEEDLGGMDLGEDSVLEDVVAGPDEFEDADDEEARVQEHLKDAVEGSLRVKRMLSKDANGEEEPAAKRRRTSNDQAKIETLLMKWSLIGDEVVRHVLEGLDMEEINALVTSAYSPDKYSQWKSPSELLAKYTAELREKRLPGGGPLDAISSFRFRWKLPKEFDARLRGLKHQELRYVFNFYDGNKSLDELIEDALDWEPDDEASSEIAVPDAPGLAAVGRMSRLEIIDACADTAVFGDANLTFSVRLARHRKSLGHVGRVIATTFEDLETLRDRYKEIDSSIKILEEHYADVFHGVDCTRLALDKNFQGLEGTLGTVYYNFPHSGAIQGFYDSHPVVNWRHENLMRLFFRALRAFLKPNATVKVASNMGAVGVRYSYIMAGAAENEFVHIETLPFQDWILHRYGRSYGDRRDAYKRPDAENNQSYNSQRAEADMVYCFRYKPSGQPLPPQEVRLPPALKTLMSCQDGPFSHLQGDARRNLAKQLHRRFIKECSGTHVG